MEQAFENFKHTRSSTDLLAYGSELLNSPTKSVRHPVVSLIQAVLLAGFNNDVSPADAALFLSELATKKADSSMVNVASMTVDLIWIMDIEHETNIGRRNKLVSLTKALIAQNFIPVDMMKERWEIDFLEFVGLIQNHKMFLKRVVRINTNQLYKQKKFNLLREESEGYSKLITELCNDTADEDTIEATREKASTVLNNIQSLIGYFDLDPNRVLDLVIDVFSTSVLTHHNFFLEFLRISPWTATATKGGALDSNKVCAQAIGFKFQILQTAENRHESPAGLYMVAALLMKNSMLLVEDVYPHLSPSDQDMDGEYRKFVAEMKDKAFSFKNNPLAMAGALSDDSPAAPSASGDKKEEKPKEASSKPEEVPPEIPHQKVGVVNALLAIGDLEHALFFLVRYPKLTASHPSTADLLCRLIHQMIQPVYEPFSPRTHHPELSVSLDGNSRYPTLSSGRPQIVVPTLFTTPPASTPKYRFEFFHTRWKDDLVRCKDIADLIEFVQPLLGLVGVRIHRDPTLIVKLCRIGSGTLSAIRADIAKTEQALKAVGTSTETYLDHTTNVDSNQRLANLNEQKLQVESIWVDFTRALFLPSISLMYANTGVVNELWKFLRQLHYEVRFGLYGEWKSDSPKLYPELLVVVASTEKEAKSVMRRINKEDVRQYGRMFAKIAHSNPLIVFASATKQLEGGYDNMVLPLTEACKYLTDFGHDVLSYALLESLSSTVRSKVQADGTTPAKWMNTMASFCGHLYRKYNSAELDGILQYLINQLRLGHAQDLVVLQELLAKMGGVEETSNLNATQLLTMAGGDLLKYEAIFSANTTKKNMRSCLRLQEAMMHDSIATQLLVLIAQHRQSSIFGADEIPHLKLLSNLADQAHLTFLQYMDFLSTNLQKQCPTIVPSLKDLCEIYKVEPGVAMHITRPKLQELVKRYYAEKKLEDDKIVNTDKDEKDLRKESGVSTVKASSTSNDGAACLPCLAETVEEVTSLLPPRAWRAMSPEFFVTFWQLSLYDIYVPEEQYRSEVSKLKSQVNAMDNDRTVFSSTVVQKRRKERERLMQTAARLELEMETQLAHHARVKARLIREKDHWFPEACERHERHDAYNSLAQYCFSPRAILSGLDALFCSRFILLLHSIGATNFSTLTLYDTVLLNVDRISFLSTECEAKVYGQFVGGILTKLGQWHTNKDLYNREARAFGLQGFRKKWGPKSENDQYVEEDMLGYEDYRHVLYKWHGRLFRSIQAALASGDYMRIKNYIMIMREIVTCFPAIVIMGEKIFDVVQKLSETETRGDLKLMLNAYKGVLSKVQQSNKWINVHDFHFLERKNSPKERLAGSTTAGVGTPALPASNRPHSQPREAARTDERAANRPGPSTLAPPGTPLARAASKDRANVVARDTRPGGTTSPIGRKVVPLPPKPGAQTPHDQRQENSSARDSPSLTQPAKAEVSPELLVISLKNDNRGRDGGGSPNINRDKQPHREPGKDSPLEPRDARPEPTRPGSSNLAYDIRDSNNNNNSNNKGGRRDHGPMRDARDNTQNRKDLRDMAPRDPRDRDIRDRDHRGDRDGGRDIGRDTMDRDGGGRDIGGRDNGGRDHGGRDNGRDHGTRDNLARGGNLTPLANSSRVGGAPRDPRDVAKDRESPSDKRGGQGSPTYGGDGLKINPVSGMAHLDKERIRDKDRNGREAPIEPPRLSDRDRERERDRAHDRDRNDRGRDRDRGRERGDPEREKEKDKERTDVKEKERDVERGRDTKAEKDNGDRGRDRNGAGKEQEEAVGSRAKDSPRRGGDTRVRDGRDYDRERERDGRDRERDHGDARDRDGRGVKDTDDGRGRRSDAVASTRTGRDQHGSNRRQDILNVEEADRRSSKDRSENATGRIDRRTDSKEHKRGRESRNSSLERTTKRRRDDEENGHSRSDSRDSRDSRDNDGRHKRQVDVDREQSRLSRQSSPSKPTGTAAEADARAMPPPARIDGANAALTSNSSSPSGGGHDRPSGMARTYSSRSDRSESRDEREPAGSDLRSDSNLIPVSSAPTSKRIKLNRPSAANNSPTQTSATSMAGNSSPSSSSPLSTIHSSTHTMLTSPSSTLSSRAIRESSGRDDRDKDRERDRERDDRERDRERDRGRDRERDNRDRNVNYRENDKNRLASVASSINTIPVGGLTSPSSQARADEDRRREDRRRGEGIETTRTAFNMGNGANGGGGGGNGGRYVNDNVNVRRDAEGGDGNRDRRGHNRGGRERR